MRLAARPVALLADSRPLFTSTAHGALGDVLRTWLKRPLDEAKAAYIGYSNRNDPQQYSIFEQAARIWGIGLSRMIPLRIDDSDWQYVRQCDLLVLAGGDVQAGMWRMSANGLDQALRDLARDGAFVMGLSAGAVQLGLTHEQLPLLGIVPFLIDVHNEPDWIKLSALARSGRLPGKALGIPSGEALLSWPAGRITTLNGLALEACGDYAVFENVPGAAMEQRHDKRINTRRIM